MPPQEFESLEPRTFPVKIRGKDYLIVEADAPTSDAYAAAALKGVKMTLKEASGDKIMENMSQMVQVQTALVSRCLWELVNGVRKDTPVGEDFVKTLTHRERKFVFDKAKEISELDEIDDPDKLEKQANRLLEKAKRLREGKAQPSGTADSSGSQ